LREGSALGRLQNPVALHRPVALPTSVQTLVATTLDSVVASVEQSIEFVSRWLLDVENQKPSAAVKVRYPLEAMEGIVESADGSSSYALPHCFEEDVSVLGLDLQRS